MPDNRNGFTVTVPDGATHEEIVDLVTRAIAQRNGVSPDNFVENTEKPRDKNTVAIIGWRN